MSINLHEINTKPQEARTQIFAESSSNVGHVLSQMGRTEVAHDHGFNSTVQGRRQAKQTWPSSVCRAGGA